MNANTARLLESLRQTTDGLLYQSEAEYPIEPFLWDAAAKGTLTPEKLLASEGFLRQVEISEIFPQNLKFHGETLSAAMQAEDQKQHELIDFLRSRCKTVEVYLAQKDDAPNAPFQEFEAFPLILAETQAGEWLGITPEVSADFQRRMRAESLISDHDPYLEKKFWQTARDIDPSLAQQKADFYVRFDLHSFLEKSSEIELFQTPTGSFSVRDFLIKQEGSTRLVEMFANRNVQIGSATLSLASEIKEMLVGTKLFVTAYYQKHEEKTQFILRVAASKAALIADLLYANGFCGLYQFVKFSDEAELNYQGDPEEQLQYEQFTEFYDETETSEDELEEQRQYEWQYERLKSLDQLLLSNLSNLREYVVGCISVFYLYSVGQTADGDWVGVRTTAVWT